MVALRNDGDDRVVIETDLNSDNSGPENEFNFSDLDDSWHHLVVISLPACAHAIEAHPVPALLACC